MAGKCWLLLKTFIDNNLHRLKKAMHHKSSFDTYCVSEGMQTSVTFIVPLCVHNQHRNWLTIFLQVMR